MKFIKLFILPLILLSSLSVLAINDNLTITQEEIDECVDGDERRIVYCKLEIKRFKKKYQSFLDEGYPPVRRISQEYVKKCVVGREVQAQYICKQLAFQIEMTRIKKNTDRENQEKTAAQQSNEKEKEKIRFLEYQSCLTRYSDKENTVDFCLQISKEKVNDSSSDCGLFGQSEGYCNGFHYKRSGSVMTDISRSLSGSAVIINGKAPEENEDSNGGVRNNQDQ
jgi:hypothetical protein